MILKEKFSILKYMYNFKYSPIKDTNNRQRILQVPRLVKLKLKRYLYTTQKTNNHSNIFLKRNFVRFII